MQRIVSNGRRVFQPWQLMESSTRRDVEARIHCERFWLELKPEARLHLCLKSLMQGSLRHDPHNTGMPVRSRSLHNVAGYTDQ